MMEPTQVEVKDQSGLTAITDDFEINQKHLCEILNRIDAINITLNGERTGINTESDTPNRAGQSGILLDLADSMRNKITQIKEG